MAAMKLNLILCFLLGLFSVSSAQSEYQVRFASSGTYPHAGKVEVFFEGHWGGICASDWDMNDAEVLCRELGKGYPNTITVSGGPPTGTGTKCLATVKCYGHEEHLSDCAVTKKPRTSSTVESGLVCFPPTSDAGLRLRYGPDQYSGRVEVKLASGSWDQLTIYYYNGYGYRWDSSALRVISNVCRQLGLGELNWWESIEYSSTTSMTQVHSCAYDVAHHRSCTFGTGSNTYQLFVGCHKKGSIPCSAPYIPAHAHVTNPRLNYNFGAKITVTCNASSDTFNLQCHNKGLWSGPIVSCPESTALPTNCNAPSVPRYSTLETLSPNYNLGDSVTFRCDNTSIQPFSLLCETTGLWSGPMQSCPPPVSAPTRCTSPYIPKYASAENIRLVYSIDESVTITCDSNTDRSFTLQCKSDGFWTGGVQSCPPPLEAPDKCSAPYVPRYASIQGLQLNYDYDDSIIVTCDSSTAQFNLRCDTKGQWSGQEVSCPAPTPVPEKCSAPYVPSYATIQNLQLNYDYGDSITVACDNSSAQFNLRCDTKGRWSGQEVSCPVPTQAPTRCTSPYIPKYASAVNVRLVYSIGESVTITCDSGTDRSFTLQCNSDGFWTGSVLSCSPPLEAPTRCTSPYITKYASAVNVRLAYSIGESVTITCDSNTDRSFTLQCKSDGFWTGSVLSCSQPIEGSIPCSAPYVPPHSTVQDLRLNYNFTDKVIVTCDASDSNFTLQCHNKGLWSGPVVSCPAPALLGPPAAGLVDAGKAQCSAPAVPRDSTIQNLRLSYKDRDMINVTCNEVTNGVPEWFELTCANGIWNGQNIVCPDPVIECNQPILPADSSVKTIRARYKIGHNINITCNSALVSFVWICDKDGLWRGAVASCPVSQPPNGGAAAGRFGNKEPQEKQNGRNVFITGLLVAAVIMFILVLMSMVAFSISVKGRSFGPSKHSLQDERTDRGPLPEVPAGYADYLVGDKSLYTAPYLKPDEIHHSYETYEKPI